MATPPSDGLPSTFSGMGSMQVPLATQVNHSLSAPFVYWSDSALDRPPPGTYFEPSGEMQRWWEGGDEGNHTLSQPEALASTVPRSARVWELSRFDAVTPGGHTDAMERVEKRQPVRIAV